MSKSKRVMPASSSSSQKFNWGATIIEYLAATRAYSFTASLIPILLTAAVSESSFRSIAFVRALTMGIAVQSGANLSNTYFDFQNGVDTKETKSGDKALVDARHITATGTLIFSLFCYVLGFFAVLPALIEHADDTHLRWIFLLGILLAFFYTANPFALKYMALGDITIYVCFGPLLMQGTCIMMTGSMNPLLYLYSIPVGLLTEAILHANNARDIKSDTKAGAITLASLIGLKLSFYLYIFLLVGSYLAVGIIAWRLNWGVLATFGGMNALPLN